MILEGGDFNGSWSASLFKISTNIAQLIRFNSVKEKKVKSYKICARQRRMSLLCRYWLG